MRNTITGVVLALMASPLLAQDAPTWRADADVPKLAAPPPDIEKPQFDFKVDRKALLGELELPSRSVDVAAHPSAVDGAAPAELGTRVDAESYRLERLRSVAPHYPRKALLEGTQGWVDVQVTVGPDGFVRAAEVVDASPRRVFDSAALAAVEQWQFVPPSQAGLNREVAEIIRLDFTIQ